MVMLGALETEDRIHLSVSKLNCYQDGSNSQNFYGSFFGSICSFNIDFISIKDHAGWNDVGDFMILTHLRWRW